MADADPLVSVIIPTFNREAYLREAVDSVFAQTYPNWELIVADDGSTDGTRVYLASVSDPRVRVVALEHCGIPARVRNAGLAKATGRYVAFLDDDDLWRPEKLALQIEGLAAHPERRWSYTRCDRVDQDGRAVELAPGRRWRPLEGWIFEPVIRLEAWVAMPSLVVDRDVLRQIGGFDDSLPLWEDYDLYLKLARLWPASVVDQPLAVIRYHPGNNTSTRIEALAQMVALYRLLVANPDAAAARRVARHQCARMALALSARHRIEGSPAGAIGAAVVAARHRPGDPGWLIALVKSCLRPLMPAAALRRYYRWRSA